MTERMKELAFRLSGDNVGIANVLVELVENTAIPLGYLQALDNLNIKEDQIWMLYKDVCWEDIGKMITVLQAYVLGFITASEINKAISREVVLDFNLLKEQVDNL